MNSLQDQYEKFPYPPIPLLALPKRGEAKELRIHSGKRVLIVGCGTFEPALVAAALPDAEDVVAVDLSARSIAIAKNRLAWLKFARPFSKLAPVQFLVGDAAEMELGEFDSILASNVLHHVNDPAALLQELTKKLRLNGFLRLVTYPKQSRFWMRKTSAWLRSQGFSAETSTLVKDVRQAIRSLPPSSPIRSCFESQPETGKISGLIDAFFNACENPLAPLSWEQACKNSGLQLISEEQTETSRSSFLDSFLKDAQALNCWEKLQILDNTWELCANPVLWLKKDSDSVSKNFKQSPRTQAQHPMKEADALLRLAGNSLQEYQQWLRKEVGPRTHPKRPAELLRGLSITEYDLDYLLSDDLGFGL